MAELSLKVLLFIVCLCVYIYGIKGRPRTWEDEIATEDQNSFEESNLLKKSKAKSGGDDKGHTGIKGNKKQVIDAFHLGPYHHGHPWGTVSQWPGYHWGGHPSHHGGWTGYPILGGWHRSHISKKNSKKSEHKTPLKRHMLPTFAFPAYGFAYPSLGFAAVPFTPSPSPWGYAVYRSKVPKRSSKGQTRSSVKGTSASKRWWPGYMGGWGGWGIGNSGYPGWGPFGDSWGHGFDALGLGHGWGLGVGNVFHPFLRSDVPEKHSKKDKAEKRWWPGFMGGWGGWGLGNTGYPGWGPLGADWFHGLSPYGYGYGYGHGLGHYGYGHGSGLYGFGYGFGLGHGHGLGYRTTVPDRKEEKHEGGPKRQFIQEPYGTFGYPWADYGPGFPYGPFGSFGSPFFGHGAYVPYPESLYGEFAPAYGFGPYSFGHGFHAGHGFFKSKIPGGKSKKVSKEPNKEEEATSRHFVFDFNPGRYGWGGAIYPGHGYHSVFPLLGAFTYSGLYGGYYGPYGPPRGPFGLYHRSEVPDNAEESGQSRQVINYHPGCYGWGGCIYPGCGCLGGWTWPLPCHFHHHSHHCVPCWTRSKYPKTQDVREEKGKSRQEIAGPEQDEGEGTESKDPRTHPHLEGADLLNAEMQSLAMGFPGVEKIQTPMGESNGAAAQGYNGQDMEENKENPSPESAPAASAEATPEEATESIPGMGGLTPDEGGNGFRAETLGSLEEQQEGQQQSAGELMSSFLNVNPSAEGELPAEAFGDTGNPAQYATGAEGQTTESASRRTDIPSQEERTVIKKQAVTYPYNYLYPGYMMAHGVNPYYHYTPITAAAQHVMAYPSVYPLAHAGFFPQPLATNRPSHSIHVGAPNVNIDVHTTRERIAQNPEKQKGRKLKHMMEGFSKKLKLKAKKSHGGRRKEKRQIPSVFSSQMMNRPMGFSPAQFRSPVSNMAGLVGQSMYPYLQQSQQQSQPFDMNPMSRSGLPSMTSPAMRPAAMGLPAFRAPQMRPALNPSQMAFSRQLSSITGISLPLSIQPGMGIVGMASRKKRSPSKNLHKKHDKSIKRQFLAGAPQAFQPARISPFAFQGAPLAGTGLPSFPTIPITRTRAFPAKMPQSRFSAMRMGSLPIEPLPSLASFRGFPFAQSNPFVPQPQNANFFSGGPQGPWSPAAAGGQMSPGAPFSGGLEEGFPTQGLEANQGQLVPEMRQEVGEPFQMNGDQLAGFNPMALNSVEQQPTPMFSEEGRGSEAPGPLAIGPQREMASFFSQLPTEGGLVETNNFNMQPGLTALKKSSVPVKKYNKGKSSKATRDVKL